MKKRMITVDEAEPATGQHKKPCIDCPWRRDAIPGWLGSNTAEEWVAVAHGEDRIECHTLIPAECAGAAIYRANVVKLTRDPTLLRLPADKVAVFASHLEFKKYHKYK